MKWKRVGQYKWVKGCKITESVRLPEPAERNYRRFTATIRDFQNWRLVQGWNSRRLIGAAIVKAEAIRDRIDAGDDLIFLETNTWDVVQSEETN